MIDSICREIDLSHDFYTTKALNSIYLGGGSPSILESIDLKMIFDSLSKYYWWDKNTEITLEANPDDITPEKLEAWKAKGINRLSIGIQSFSDIDLKFMNRAHNAQEADSCINMAKDHGIDNISIDLIYGGETTSDEIWKNNVAKAIALKVPHVSAYCLTVEEGTALASFVKRGIAKPLDDEKALRQFHYLIDELRKEGFDHYEISNFGKPEKYAIHNSNYWLGKPYLGIGPSAHSYDGYNRRWNVANNSKYIKALEEPRIPFTLEELSLADQYNEYVLIRLRTIWGCDLKEIKNRFSDFNDHFQLASKALIEEGVVRIYQEKLLLTEKGKFQADRVTMDLMIG